MRDGTASEQAIKAVRNLAYEQNQVAEEIYQQWEKAGAPKQFSYQVSASDEEAHELGWPSRETQLCAVAIAQFILHGVSISVVERLKSPQP